MSLKSNKVQSIKIRPLLIDDFRYVLHWSKDDTFCLVNGWEKDRDEQELYRWWLHCVNNVSEDFIRMAIEMGQRIIGYADLAHIKDNSAELGIAIGESTLWGKGFGFNASIIIMDYASRHLGITVINAETHETNIRSRKMLEKIGFKEVSRIGSEEYIGRENQLIQYRFSF
ncbi:RimJ/RimL family protein N-acetyltransferase [Bacillus oleivorans]|uniref:RimJ/RimL family protein N-acetyltransferase n=1 Tax=Bacillus oleivorans TaxID=1448271 RepID=A0A285CQC8_9BACI|nr:GNAT family N-acetyltransferase [Bacillus oleivorans]SNX69757.1 RimJ/RimL family protein N-acetyltransferase [Bacillus oleivorans]